MAVELYKHNQEAYEAAKALLDRESRAAIVHPTGSGKSFIAFKFCMDNPGWNSLWLAPSEYIFQTQRENLVLAGGEIPQNLTFMTYVRLSRMSEEEIKALKFDFIVLDEFHRCGAEVWGKSISSLLENNEKAKILGLSATNIRYLDNYRDMAQELFDGNVASEIGLAEAVVRGILSPPKYVLGTYMLQREVSRYEDRMKTMKNKAARDRAEIILEKLKHMLESADGLNELFKRHMEKPDGKYIIFCSGFAHMHEMMDQSKKWFTGVDRQPHVYYAYNEDPDVDEIFKAFIDDKSSHLKLLYCIDMLNEGIHVGDVDGVILLRPTASPILYKQQIGRAFSAGRKDSPVIFDIVMNADNLHSVDSFSKEMAEICAYYSAINREDLIINYEFTIIDEIKEVRQLFTQLDNMLGAGWDIMFSYAKEYFLQNGNLMVSNDYTTGNGYKLGLWLSNQRVAYKRGTMPAERKEKLDSIGMCWNGLKEAIWEENYKEAEKFFLENGHLNVPKKIRTERGQGLYTWLKTQRRVYYGTEKGLLDEERAKRLEKIGMRWATDEYEEYKLFLAEARKYYAEHGTLHVTVFNSKRPIDGTISIAFWVNKLRAMRRNNNPFLTDAMITELDELGMVWDVSEENWKVGYNSLVKFKEINGNAVVPFYYADENGFRLGAWLASIKRKKRKNCLSSEKAALLDALDVCWEDANTRVWNIKYEEAKKYYEEHGNLKIPLKYVTENGFRLGAWIYNQREKYGLSLTKERTEKLNSIGMVWDIIDFESAWEKKFLIAEQYYKDHGNLNVPGNYQVDGFWLGKWVNEQKQRFHGKRKGLVLTENKINRLMEIGFNPETTHNDQIFEKNYEEAKKWFEAHGSRKPTSTENPKLNSWIVRLSYRYRQGKLKPEIIERLEEIGIKFSNEIPVSDYFEC